MVACMKEQMTEKKKLEDVTEVQMKYQKEIEAIVRGMSSPKVMHDRLLDYHENDIAAALEDMNPTERQRLYRILNAEEISEVLSYIDEEEIPSYLEEMDMKKKAAVVSEMDADEIADLLRQMDKKERETLTELLDEEVRHKIDLIDSFDEEQIGSRMSTNYVEIPSNVTVKQAMRELIRQAADNDNISTLYIVDENRIFCGAISRAGGHESGGSDRGVLPVRLCHGGDRGLHRMDQGLFRRFHSSSGRGEPDHRSHHLAGHC